MALSILAISLTALMQVQARNIVNVGRARDLTVAVNLARGKMIDIEHGLFHDGFPSSAQLREGNFEAEGYPEVTFRSRVSEVQMDLGQLSESFGAKVGALGGDRQVGEGDFAGMMQQAATLVGPLIDGIAASVRVVELQVAWRAGAARPSLTLRGLVSQDDFSTQALGEEERVRRQVLERQRAGEGAAP